MPRGIASVAAAIAAAALLFPALAGATPVSATLTSANGEGTFDDTLTCGQGGDGPSWRYAYTGVSTASGALAGAWSGSVDVHQSGGRAPGAFVPAGAGRLAIDVNRGGTASLEFAGGDCAAAALTLGSDLNGDPVAYGTLPLVATGGTGSVRGLSGDGTAEVTLTLGPGADNPATVVVKGDFDVADPGLKVAGASATWLRVADYFAHKLTVTVTIANAAGTGDAFAAQLTGASPGVFTGLPAPLGTVPAGQSRSATLTLNNATPGKTYTVAFAVAARDGLDAQQPEVTGSATFKAPSLP